jgi:hypothetical protein
LINMTTKFFRKNKFPLFWRGLGGGLLWLCLPFVLSAQNGVTVTNLVLGAGTVTFDVSWKNTDMPMPWSDSVWVFVDYNDAGVMRRLPLTGATLTETSAPGFSRTESVENNNSGVWVVGNAKTASSGSFSATVKLLTATLDMGGACAYASNYPPVGEYTSAQTLRFTGTPPYDLVLRHSGGSTITQSAGSNVYTVPLDYTLLSYIDKTGVPGIVRPTTVSLLSSQTAICKGVSVTLTAAANGAASYSFDGGTTWQAEATLTESLTATKSYALKVKSVAGHVSSDSKSATVVVYPDFTPGAISATGQTPCIGAALNNIMSSTAASGGDGAITYLWTYSGTSAATLTTNSATLTPPSELKDVPGAYTFTRWAMDGTCNTTWTAGGNAWKITVEGQSTPSVPVVMAAATFCFGFPGQLTATASSGGTIEWYNADAGGDLLYTGNVLPLAPLYNATAQYYAQEISSNQCDSQARIQALYTVNNCVISGDCPGYTAGGVSSNVTPAACAAHYAGQIGAAAISSSCMVHDAGRIGKNN